MSRTSLFLPLGLFLLMAFMLWRGFALNDPHELPSALLNQPLPDFQKTRLADGAPCGAAGSPGRALPLERLGDLVPHL